MAIDPSIPLRGEGLNLGDLMRQGQDMRLRQMQVDEYQRKQSAEAEQRSALSDLIATRSPTGSYDTSGSAFQRYTQADPNGAFELLGKMDEQKRKATEAGLEDLAAAVQWADTPEKWEVAKRHYAQNAPQVAAVPFDQREQVLLSLGKLGDYLKNTAPKVMSIEAGGSLATVDPRTGKPTFTVLPNPGTETPGAPASGGGSGVSEGATATNPSTGQKIIYRGGQWVPVGGGQTASPSGPFRQ